MIASSSSILTLQSWAGHRLPPTPQRSSALQTSPLPAGWAAPADAGCWKPGNQEGGRSSLQALQPRVPHCYHSALWWCFSHLCTDMTTAFMLSYMAWNMRSMQNSASHRNFQRPHSKCLVLSPDKRRHHMMLDKICSCLLLLRELAPFGCAHLKKLLWLFNCLWEVGLERLKDITKYNQQDTNCNSNQLLS